jgi:hypothetical protein
VGHPIDDERFVVRRRVRLDALRVFTGDMLVINIHAPTVHTLAIKCIEDAAHDMRTYPGDMAIEPIVSHPSP